MGKSDARIDKPANQAEADQARRALDVLRQGLLASGANASPPAATVALERILERGHG